MRLASAAQMREIDRCTIEEYGFPGMVLMENAGRAVAAAAGDLLAAEGGLAVILVGKGNNGGDGFVAARHLAGMGVDTLTLLFCPGEDLSGDAAANYRYAVQIGLTIIEQPDDEELLSALEQADVVVDALLGTGISGEVHGRLREVIVALGECAAPVVAVDIPSGVNADTGQPAGVAVEAHTTVTFGLAKPGHMLYPGRAHTGILQVADIGLASRLVADPALNTLAVTAEECAVRLPYRAADAHKGDAGRVFVLAGSTGMSGAAALAGQGAARAGAGLVTVAVPETVNPVVEAMCAEVMTVPLPCRPEGVLDFTALPVLADYAARADAVAIGPGLRTDGCVPRLVELLAAQVEVPLVLDADALNALAKQGQVLTRRQTPTVITPHPGELARLTGTDIAAIQADRLTAARGAAETFGCIVVLKGAATVIAAPDGEAWINTTGNAGMASGGMGDVLTGVIAALAAGGADVLAAAVAGVFLHGLAGDIAARELGPRGILAGDAAARLPVACRQVWEETAGDVQTCGNC